MGRQAEGPEFKTHEEAAKERRGEFKRRLKEAREEETLNKKQNIMNAKDIATKKGKKSKDNIYIDMDKIMKNEKKLRKIIEKVKEDEMALSIFNDDMKTRERHLASKAKKEGKTSKGKTPKEKLINRIFENPIISKKALAQLKRYMDSGGNMSMSDLETWEQLETVGIPEESDTYYEEMARKREAEKMKVYEPPQKLVLTKKQLKESPIEKKYKEIFANPRIEQSAKDALKRRYDAGNRMGKLDLESWEEDEERYFQIAQEAEAEKAPKPKAKEAPKPKSKKTTSKNIMKGRADLKGNRVNANLNIKKGLDPKVKRALRKAVIEDLDKKISGSGLKKLINKIYLSDSDSD